jgi:hypothetical protein
MREIAISKFKATCLAVLEDVRRTGAPVRVTRFGRLLMAEDPSQRLSAQLEAGGDAAQ